MGVVSVEEIWDGRSAEDGIDRVRRYTRRFQVITDDPSDDGTVAGGPQAGLLGLPRNGDRHPNDVFARMKKIRPEQATESPTLWYVSCDYDTELPKGIAGESQQFDDNGETTPGDTATDPSNRAENPVDRQPKWKVTYEQTTEPAVVANRFYPLPGDPTKSTNLILNSAGDPYDPPPMLEVSRPVIEVTFAVANIDFAALQNFQDAVNITAWKGNPARTLRIIGTSADSAQENGQSFWWVTMRFKVKADTWDIKLVDMGFNELDGAGKKVRMQDGKTGAFPSDPQLLDNNGHKLAEGNPPFYRTFRIYPEKEFSLLGVR